MNLNFSENSTEMERVGNCSWFSLPKTRTKVLSAQGKWYFICTHHTDMGDTLDEIIKNVRLYSIYKLPIPFNAYFLQFFKTESSLDQ